MSDGLSVKNPSGLDRAAFAADDVARTVDDAARRVHDASQGAVSALGGAWQSTAALTELTSAWQKGLAAQAKTVSGHHTALVATAADYRAVARQEVKAGQQLGQAVAADRQAAGAWNALPDPASEDA
jgi:hypothetical protein